MDGSGNAKKLTKLGKKGSSIHKREKNKLNFVDYFSAYRNRKDFISSQSDSVNKLDFTIDTYNEIIEKLQKNKKSKKFFQTNFETEIENSEIINKLTKNGLYDLIINLLMTDSNVFLYGFGSKLKLIYDFINYFQFQINCEENENVHILVFNCYNPEVNMKYLLNQIQNYLITQIDSLGHAKEDFTKVNSGFKCFDDEIAWIRLLLETMIKLELCTKILLIFNNIDGPNFQNRSFQYILSQLSAVAEFSILVTSDNLYINYFWDQSMKDNFSFYFLKFHTFVKYELEINENNSLTGNKNIKSGLGLSEVIKSLTRNQKDLLKVMANIQIKGDLSLMTAKALVDFMKDNGYGICNDQTRFMELIFEPVDHEIIVATILPKNNKQIYKLNLDNDIIEKIAKGEYECVNDNDIAYL